MRRSRAGPSRAGPSRARPAPLDRRRETCSNAVDSRVGGTGNHLEEIEYAIRAIAQGWRCGRGGRRHCWGRGRWRCGRGPTTRPRRRPRPRPTTAPATAPSTAPATRPATPRPSPSDRPATAPAAKAGPGGHIVQKGDLSFIIQTDGVFLPADAGEVKIQFKAYAGPVQVAAVAAPGAFVRKGDTLLEIDRTWYNWQLTGVEHENTAAKLNLAEGRGGPKSVGEKADAMALRPPRTWSATPTRPSGGSRTSTARRCTRRPTSS